MNPNGKWLKGPRVTMSEELMKLTRKRGVPGPIYKSPRGVGEGVRKDKSGAQDAKSCMFLDQAMFNGEKTPTAKLNLNFN